MSATMTVHTLMNTILNCVVAAIAVIIIITVVVVAIITITTPTTVLILFYAFHITIIFISKRACPES